MTPEQVKEFLTLRRSEIESRLSAAASQIKKAKTYQERTFFEREKSGRIDQILEFKSIIEGKI